MKRSENCLVVQQWAVLCNLQLEPVWRQARFSQYIAYHLHQLVVAALHRRDIESNLDILRPGALNSFAANQK